MPDNLIAGAPRMFAHRGTTLLAPENTIAAFDLALHYQCDVLETDVRLSKDNVVMVFHDETLNRTTNGTGPVRQQTCKALKKLDAAARFKDINGNSHTGTKQTLITLDELFEQYPTVGINIDIKDNDPQAAIAVAKSIQQKHHPLSTSVQRGSSAPPGSCAQPYSSAEQSNHQWINVGSFHERVIKQFRQLAPDVSTAATRQEVARMVFGFARTASESYQLLQIPQSYWGIQLSGKRLIQKAHAQRCNIMYWTINDKNKMQALLKRGADGIITDRPDLALDVFRAMGFKR